jgi:hypothetical protein
MERWPLAELQRRLNGASRRHSESPTLGDFRADPVLVRRESEALARAGKLITPHRAIARHFGNEAWLLDWEMPDEDLKGSHGAQGWGGGGWGRKLQAMVICDS